MRNALIIGGTSTIGSALAQHLRTHNIDVSFTTRRELDLGTSPEKWPTLPTADVTYLCAAATKLDMCENNPEATRLINVIHMQALAERLQQNGSFVVFLSSNQVFDGAKPYRTVDEAPSPINEYGRQKAAFEAWLLARKNPAAVLRLTKIISGPLPVIAGWKEALACGENIEAFHDLRFAPLPLENAIDALIEIGNTKKPGIHHLSGTRDVSYFDIAKRVAERMGLDESRVTGTRAAIPKNFLPAHGTLKTSLNISVPDPERIIL